MSLTEDGLGETGSLYLCC